MHRSIVALSGSAADTLEIGWSVALIFVLAIVANVVDVLVAHRTEVRLARQTLGSVAESLLKAPDRSSPGWSRTPDPATPETAATDAAPSADPSPSTT